MSFLSIIIILLSSISYANPRVNGQTSLFYSPDKNWAEACITLDKIPGGKFSHKDLKKEKNFCQYDFYSEWIALCPKTWSTSPATIVNDLSKSRYSRSAYESSDFCGHRGKKRGPDVEKVAKFKMSMNQKGTSGTYSKSSLLYYHLARYFQTEVKVPVSVYREINREEYRQRGVAARGMMMAKHAMISAGWKWLSRAVDGMYMPERDIFAGENNRSLYGVLIDGSGQRYGPEINGVRGGGPLQQNKMFQDTPAFYALRTNASLLESIRRGISHWQDVAGLSSHVKEVNELQIVFWMRELVEINVLDFLLSQQDRVGNIDYKYFWYYVKDGEQKRKKAKFKYKNKTRQDLNLPQDLDLVDDDGVLITSYNPILVQRTYLNDNDAGVKMAYSNLAKKAGHLDGLRHFSLNIYRKLLALNTDLQNQGEIYNWAQTSLQLPAKDLYWWVENTRLAVEILKNKCVSGEIVFDLDNVNQFLVDGVHAVDSDEINCNLY